MESQQLVIDERVNSKSASASSLSQKFFKSLKRLGPLFFFTLITAFYTYPLIFQFTTGVVGQAGLDRSQNLWNFWWVGQAFTHGHNPYKTDLLFFPFYQPPNSPYPLYFHTLQVFNGVASLPFQWLGGVAAAFNAVIFGATLFSGLGTYWLVRRLGSSITAGLVAGSIYAFAPFRLWTIERSYTNIQSTQFLPLYAFFLLGTEKPGLNKKMLVGAILTLTFCIYNDWYNTIYLLVYTAFYFGWRLMSHPRSWKQVLAWVGLIGSSSFVLTMPLLLPILTNLNDSEFKLVPGYDRDVAGSTNLAGLFLPNGATGITSMLGYTGLLLALIAGLSLFGRQIRRGWLSRAGRAYWLILAATAVLLSLGPELQITGGESTQIPLPYALFRQVPMVSITNYPDRFLILAMLAIAVLSAYSLDWLRGAAKPKRWLKWVTLRKRQKVVGGTLAGITLGLLILETWSPMSTFEYKHNAFIEGLAKDTGSFNLLELPLNRQYRLFHSRMYNQMVHGRPILGGYLSRLLATDPYRTPGSPFKPIADFRSQDEFGPSELDIVPTYTNAEALDNLVNLYNFRYILLYMDEFREADLENGLISLIEQHYGKQQVVYKDEHMQVYRVPDEYLTKQPGKVPVTLGDGWYPIERDAQDYWRWASADSRVFATGSDIIAEKVQVQLKIRSFEQERTLQVQLNNQAVFEVKVPSGPAGPFSFEITLPPGQNELRLLALEGDRSPAELDPASTDDRRLAFAVHSIKFVKG